jgi:hypothetical protein
LPPPPQLRPTRGCERGLWVADGGQQRAFEGGARGEQRDPKRVDNAEPGCHRDHRGPGQHGGTHRSHTTTRPDETRIEHFQARSNTAHYGNDGNLIDDPQSGSETGRSRGLVTVSDAPRAIRRWPDNYL